MTWLYNGGIGYASLVVTYLVQYSNDSRLTINHGCHSRVFIRPANHSTTHEVTRVCKSTSFVVSFLKHKQRDQRCLCLPYCCLSSHSKIRCCYVSRTSTFNVVLIHQQPVGETTFFVGTHKMHKRKKTFDRTCLLRIASRVPLSLRCTAPGMPPGHTTASQSRSSHSSILQSAFILTPREHVT